MYFFFFKVSLFLINISSCICFVHSVSVCQQPHLMGVNAPLIYCLLSSNQFNTRLFSFILYLANQVVITPITQYKLFVFSYFRILLHIQ